MLLTSSFASLFFHLLRLPEAIFRAFVNVPSLTYSIIFLGTELFATASTFSSLSTPSAFFLLAASFSIGSFHFIFLFLLIYLFRFLADLWQKEKKRRMRTRKREKTVRIHRVASRVAPTIIFSSSLSVSSRSFLFNILIFVFKISVYLPKKDNRQFTRLYENSRRLNSFQY